MRRPSTNAKRSLTLVSERRFYTRLPIQSHENESSTNPEGLQQRRASFDFEGFKALNASSSSDSQEKVFHLCVSWALTHFKHTLPQFSPFRDGEHEVEGCKSHRSSGACLFEGNLPFPISTRTFTASDRAVSVWLMAAVWAQMTPCPRVNRMATGVAGPSVLLVSVNTN